MILLTKRFNAIGYLIKISSSFMKRTGYLLRWLNLHLSRFVICVLRNGVKINPNLTRKDIYLPNLEGRVWIFFFLFVHLIDYFNIHSRHVGEYIWNFSSLATLKSQSWVFSHTHKFQKIAKSNSYKQNLNLFTLLERHFHMESCSVHKIVLPDRNSPIS